MEDLYFFVSIINILFWFPIQVKLDGLRTNIYITNKSYNANEINIGQSSKLLFPFILIIIA